MIWELTSCTRMVVEKCGEDCISHSWIDAKSKTSHLLWEHEFPTVPGYPHKLVKPEAALQSSTVYLIALLCAWVMQMHEG